MQRSHRMAEQRLAHAGARLTKGRARVLDVLEAAPGPITAAEIQDELGDSVPVSSLYRTLNLMVDTGVVSTLHGAGGIARFELSETVTGHHHHLVCVECDTVEDVHLDQAGEDRLVELSHHVAGSAGFSASGHTLEIEGVCRDCAS